jgi:hypothetical protein
MAKADLVIAFKVHAAAIGQFRPVAPGPARIAALRPEGRDAAMRAERRDSHIRQESHPAQHTMAPTVLPRPA